jgi:hypothetical protein
LAITTTCLEEFCYQGAMLIGRPPSVTKRALQNLKLGLHCVE